MDKLLTFVQPQSFPRLIDWLIIDGHAFGTCSNRIFQDLFFWNLFNFLKFIFLNFLSRIRFSKIDFFWKFFQPQSFPRRLDLEGNRCGRAEGEIIQKTWKKKRWRNIFRLKWVELLFPACWSYPVVKLVVGVDTCGWDQDYITI